VLAGAAGVVLGEQLWLAAESPDANEIRPRWQYLDGSETRLLGDDVNYRFFSRSGRRTLDEVARQVETGGPWLQSLQTALTRRDVATPDAEQLIPLGEEIAFAASLAKRFKNVAGILGAFRRAMRDNLALARRQKSLDADSPLAQSHGTQYPIVQGPMTRVSDVAAFGDAVSQSGALPMFAFALSRKAEVQHLLEEATSKLGERSWGIGLLGFIPDEIRAEQLEVLCAFRPTHAVIAGGRPDQAASLDAAGIETYLHVPSPGLLEAYIRDGSRRFVLEGRECGGHVGPRSSFTLWQSAVEVLCRVAEADFTGQLPDFQILFAGGIHDCFSSAMVATIAAPIVARGAKIGVLIGTAYLFTPEAVSTGAITTEFQRQALACRHTTLLESGLGHASRCVETPFAAEFQSRRRELAISNASPDQVRFELELLNLGRLRLASKGIKRLPAVGKAALVQVSEDEQRQGGMYMIGDAATLIGQLQSMAELHSDLCRGSVEVLDRAAPAVEHRHLEPPAAGDRRQDDAIAIVGMSCLFPECKDLREYWQNICRKFDAVREVPPARWREETFFSAERAAPDRVYSKWGAFLGEIHFDPFRYSIPPASLKSIEPIQLLSLELARRALEDAGYAPRENSGRETSVIFAVSGPHEMGMAYGFRTMLRGYLADADDLPEEMRRRVLESLEEKLPRWTEDSFAGFLNNVVAGRISNHLDLMGPNFVVDAACAASLAAVHVAIEQLRSGACSTAVVGAVDATNSPMAYMSFAKTHALLPRGRSCPLDQSADGIVLGEGVGVLVLKRLADAERDGDRIYALIRGIGAGSDGRHRSLTAPHPAGQVCTLQRAYENAGLSPARVSLVECHGTGTVVGDQAEIEALQLLFQTAGARPRTCAVGSVKSMIGHTKTVAGLAGLIKTALALHQQVLPPTSNVAKPNRQLELEGSALYVEDALRPWIRENSSQPRCAGVSAFGFGGTNFHIVLEEYEAGRSHASSQDLNPRPAEIFTWTAPDRASLLQRLESFQRRLAETPDVDLPQLAFSLLHAQGREAQANGPLHRMAIVTNDRAELQKAIQHALETIRDGAAPHPRSGVFYGDTPPAAAGNVCFVFPGQGAQRVEMLKELLLLHPEGTQRLEQADRIVAEFFEQPLSSYFYPPPVFDDQQRGQQASALTDARVAPAALSVTSLAAFDLLQCYGLAPDFVAGHSHGEWIALCAAGCLAEEDLLRLSAARGKAIWEASRERPGAMAAAFADAETTLAALEALKIPAEIANYNSPQQTVIAGSPDAIARAVAEFPARGITIRSVPVAAAFHTKAMSPAVSALTPLLQRVPIYAPRTTSFSNATCQPYPQDAQAIRELVLRQFASPVRFVEEICELHRAGARLFIEVGAGNICTNNIERILEGQPHEAMPLDVPGRDAGRQFAQVLARCYALGLPVTLAPWFAGRGLVVQDADAYFAAKDSQRERESKQWIVGPQRIRPPASANKPPQPPSAKTSSAKPSPNPQRPRLQHNSLFNARKHMNSPDPASSNGQEKAAAAEHRTPAATVEPHAPPGSLRFGEGETRVLVASDALTQLQENLANWLELQKASQQSNQQFLEVQSQVIQLLSGNAVTAPVAARLLPPATRMRSLPQSNGNGNGTGIEIENGNHHVAAAAPPLAPVIPPLSVGELHRPAAAPVWPKETTTHRLFPDPAARHEWRPESLAPSAPPPQPVSSPLATTTEIATVDDFRAALLEATSRRTGYPPEMLEEDLLLEADLGIDSIKRIEILKDMKDFLAFAETRQKSEEEMVQLFTRLRTLGDVIENFRQERAELLESLNARETKHPSIVAAAIPTLRAPATRDPASTAEANGHASKSPPAVAQPVERFLPRLVEQSLSGDATHRRLVPPGHCLLALGEAAAAVDLTMLAQADDTICQVLPGSGAAKVRANCYRVDFGSPASLAELHGLLSMDGHRVGGLVNLLGLAERFAQPGVPRADDALELTVWILNAVKEFRAEILESLPLGGRLVNVTTLGGDFGFESGRPLPLAQAATLGLFKTLHLEWTGSRVTNIDLDPTLEPETLRPQISAEIFNSHRVLEVGLGRRGRRIVQLAASPLTAEQSSNLKLDSRSVVLVTGGGRGITAAAARAFAERYGCRVVVVGRTPEPEPEASETSSLLDDSSLKQYLIQQAKREEEIPMPSEIDRRLRAILIDRQVRDSLAVLRRSAAAVEYHSLDVSKTSEFARLIDEVYDRYGRIDVAIHGAGIIEDRWIYDKTPESLARVFRVKVAGANVLAEKLRPDSLQCAVFYSSVASRFGNVGQVDYSAANEYLNKLANHLNSLWDARVVSIQWGPWNGGMVDANMAAHIARTSLSLIPIAGGVEALMAECGASHAPPEVVIGCGVPQMQRISEERNS
jgi:acyl transferase domain-containing protein/NAD(P)H-dependent flavin oxidoreductase YrpB (nitropropane dioxygenase family)